MAILQNLVSFFAFNVSNNVYLLLVILFVVCKFAFIVFILLFLLTVFASYLSKIVNSIFDVLITGEPSIRKLLDALDSHFSIPVRDVTSPFLIPIDNAFTVAGRGSIAIGTIKRGTIKRNDSAALMGFGVNFKTSISDIQIFRQSVKSVRTFELLPRLWVSEKLTSYKLDVPRC